MIPRRLMSIHFGVHPIIIKSIMRGEMSRTLQILSRDNL